MSGGVELGNSGSSALIIPTKDNRIIDHPEILKVSSAILLGDLKAFGRPTEAIKSSSPLGNNREKAEEYTIKFLKEFGYPGDLFGGIKKLDNPNAAADVVYGATVAESRIYFNEDWIGALTIDLIERIAAHEAQHIKTFELSERGLKLERLNEIEEFKALQLRVGDYYDKISKTEKALPHTKEEYQSPAELLSRLRGYWAYLMQIEKEDKITIRPREFVGVFKEEDLKFLNEEYLFFITFSDNFVAQGIVEHNMYVKNKSEAGNQKLEVSSAVKAGEDLYNDAQAVLYVSKPEDLQISDNPKIKRIWGEMVEENLKLYKFAQGLTRLSRKYGVIKEFPEDELNNLCKFYNNLNQKTRHII